MRFISKNIILRFQDLQVKLSWKAPSSTRNGGSSSSHDAESKGQGGEDGAEQRELQIIPTEDNHKDTATFPARIAVKVRLQCFKEGIPQGRPSPS